MFKPKTGIIILAASSGSVSCAADTAENALATITVPGGWMGLNGILRWHAVWTYTNSANTKTIRTRFGGVAGTIYFSIAPTTTTYSRDFRQLQNQGAANSQKGVTAVVTSTTWASDAASIVTSSVDTSADTSLVFSGQKASSGETLTLESYLVELIRP